MWYWLCRIKRRKNNGKKLKRETISFFFSFPSQVILTSKDKWNSGIFNQVVKKDVRLQRCAREIGLRHFYPLQTDYEFRLSQWTLLIRGLRITHIKFLMFYSKKILFPRVFFFLFYTH